MSPRDLAPAKSSSQYILIHLEFSPLQEKPPGIPLKLQMGGRGNFGPQLALPYLQLKDLGRNEVMSIFTSARAQQPDHNSKRVQCQSRKCLQDCPVGVKSARLEQPVSSVARGECTVLQGTQSRSSWLPILALPPACSALKLCFLNSNVARRRGDLSEDKCGKTPSTPSTQSSCSQNTSEMSWLDPEVYYLFREHFFSLCSDKGHYYHCVDKTSNKPTFLLLLIGPIWRSAS